MRQDNSAAAAAFFQSLSEPLHVTSLLLFEFRQGVRFQVWLNSQNRNKGYPRATAEVALNDLQANLDSGALVSIPADWPDVYRLAESISQRNTSSNGHRSLDILHVATALHLEAKEFITFDINQRKLAAAEKLKVRP